MAVGPNRTAVADIGETTAPALVPADHLVSTVSVRQRRSKRLLDIAGSLVALIVLSPIYLLISVAVVLTDPGPVFFRQVRVGARGLQFEIVKFRSMRSDAERVLQADAELQRRYLANGYKLGVHEDRRLTPIGRFLRTSSVDELPQFWNVLKGDMSLVGPRPVLPWELEECYGTARPLYEEARPGLTGPWQVSGRSDVEYSERVKFDAHYVNSWSFSRDVAILAQTPRAVLMRRGAN